MSRITSSLLLLTGTLAFSNLFGLTTGDSIAHFSARSSIPAIVTPPNMGGLEYWGEIHPFGNIDAGHFEQGYVNGDWDHRIQLQGMSSNVPVVIRIQNNGWYLPWGYDTVEGPKHVDGSDGDFMLFVNPDGVGAARGVISALGPYASDYTSISNYPAEVLRMGSDPSTGRIVGVKDGQAYLLPRMKLDPVYDIPGEYGVVLEMTVGTYF